MKISITRKAKQIAATLLIVLVTCTIFAVAIMGYLSVIEHQNYLCARSQSWDSAMTVVEAGIEEGLEHLNNNTNNLGVDGWTQTGTTYTQNRTLANGNSYVVTIDNTIPTSPSIVSRASVVPPPSLLSLNQHSMLLATGGQTANSTASVIKRAVRVQTSKGLLFTTTLVAKEDIDLKGNGVMTDSFNSSQPGVKSDTNGHYNASIYSGDKGDIASIGGLNSSVSIQNANVYGMVHTGPDQAVSVGSQGAVGTHAWQAGHGGFQPGYVLKDANFTFPDCTLPSTSDAVTPLAGNVIMAYYNGSPTPTSSATFPNNNPTGGVGTNVGSVITATLPNPIPPGLTSNTVSTTSGTYPTVGTYLGNVTTNNVTLTTPTLPSPLPPLPRVTNTTVTTTAGYPAAGTYMGSVTTNRPLTTSASLPSPLPAAPITTNTSSTTTVGYPAAGTYIGNVTTNRPLTTTASLPSPLPAKPITTNTTSTTTGGYPAAGTYIGGVTTNWNGGHNHIQGYTYNLITGYSYYVITGYTYTQINGYSYYVITGYTYSQITSYSYPGKTYTYNGIVSYTYPTYTYLYSLWTTNVTYTTNSYDHILESGRKYTMANLAGKTYVAGPDVTLVLPSGWNMPNGADSLKFASDGVLSVYVGGTSISIEGNKVVNPNGYAGSLIVYCPNVTSFSLGGNGSFTGVLIAPNAQIDLHGGGNNDQDFIGVLMCKSIKMNGHFKFHYDEALQNAAKNGRYLITSWDEINPY